jgi:hypothetical protein
VNKSECSSSYEVKSVHCRSAVPRMALLFLQAKATFGKPTYFSIYVTHFYRVMGQNDYDNLVRIENKTGDLGLATGN